MGYDIAKSRSFCRSVSTRESSRVARRRALDRGWFRLGGLRVGGGNRPCCIVSFYARESALSRRDIRC